MSYSLESLMRHSAVEQPEPSLLLIIALGGLFLLRAAGRAMLAATTLSRRR